MGVNSCRSMEASFRERLEQYNMLDKDSRVLAAVSGGADSVCMLYLLISAGYKPHVVHVHHMIRGHEADRDAEFVSELCKKLGLGFSLIYKDVPAAAKQRGLSQEQAARECRYEALFELAEKIGADRIAVAHNQNDQAETVLMRLIRGSGLTGLIGMRPVRPDGLIRPLLFFSRAEIEEYCDLRGIAYVTDSTNLSEEYSRNYVRRKLLPAMEALNGSVRCAVARSAELLSADEDYLDKQASMAFEKTASEQENRIYLDIQRLSKMDRAIARRVVRLAVMKKCGLTDITVEHIDGVLQLCRAQTGKSTVIKRNVSAWKSYGKIIIGESEKTKTFCIPFALGEYNVGAWTVTAKKAASRDRKGQNEEYIDMDKLPADTVLRSRRNGDRIFPLGAPGEKKLKEFFIDKKIPREQREKLILLASGNEILAVIGIIVSEKIKVDEETRNIIIIKAVGED